LSVKKPDNFYSSSKLLNAKHTVKTVSLQLPSAHPKQFELISSLDANPDLRFIVGACGSKFGKTFGSTIAIVQQAWNNANSLNWWVAPTFAQSKMAYTLIKRLLPKETFLEYKADLKLVLLQPDGTERSTIEFKSGDNPDSLRGFGVKFFVMDEAARCPYESFVSLFTTITQTYGRGFFISTPHARNWFYDVYRRGEKEDKDGNPKYGSDEEDPWKEWHSIRMPTWANPHVPLESIKHLRKNLPEDVFRQEVAAEFLDGTAGVFRGVSDCIRPGGLTPYQSGHTYVMGVDLARLRDYSVITVEDRATRHVVYFERFNQISWEAQYARIADIARRYRAQVWMDSTGIGDPIVDTIRRSGINVEPFKIGGSAIKQQLIDKLRVNIENQRITFPLIPVLKRELESYEYNVSENGVVRFSAPSGEHDDAVISLALANWGADKDPWTYKYQNLRGF
jgi:hypothetical protein